MPQIVARTCSDLHPVFVFMLADAENVAREEDSVFPMLQAMANAPIFSDRDGYFGNGIVGGPLISTEQRRHPVPLSAFAPRGTGDIKTPTIGFSTPKFDWRALFVLALPP